MTFVLLDDQGTGKQWVFRKPERIITAHHRSDLQETFAHIEAAQTNGKWLAGWMSYELGHALETRFGPPNAPLIKLGVFDTPAKHPSADWLYTRDIPALNFKPNWTEAEYLKRFESVQKYLRAGDCYQVNLTFPMHAKSEACANQIYAAFRRRQPGRYGAVISLGETDIVSFSPELFFERKGRQMRMRPMKGTRPRSHNAKLDAEILTKMQAEPKSRAENLMIVDLLRNDLSRLCEPGSVNVPELFTLETYPTLHQMTSQVTGTLKAKVTWADIFQSLFPCGSVTGAPKIRAMEIISELESGPRGAYCGAVGYIAPRGDASFSVAIRTIQKSGNNLRYDVGSGVVLDSDGPDEYRECLLKSHIFDIEPEGIIETFRRLPNGDIPREDIHINRLKDSIGNRAKPAIQSTQTITPQEDLRIRLIAKPDTLTTEEMPYTELDTPLLLGLSRYALGNTVQETQHKTTARDFYDGECARLKALIGADEVIFLNSENALCEGSFTSLFVEKNGTLLTPALSCGLLPGVLRQALIEQGNAVEAVLTLEDIKTAEAIFVGNSLRGLMPAAFIDLLPH